VVYGYESGYGLDWKLFPVSFEYPIIKTWAMLTDMIFRTLVQTLGYNKNITLLLTAPPYIVAAIASWVATYRSDVCISVHS
jgi:hypothetical protein